MSSDSCQEISSEHIGSVLPPPIGPMAADALARHIAEERVALTADFFAESLDGDREQTARHGEGATGVKLLAAAAREPKLLSEFLSHWSTAFFCIRSLQTGDRKPLAQLFPGLALLLARASIEVPELAYSPAQPSRILPFYIADCLAYGVARRRRWKQSELLGLIDGAADDTCSARLYSFPRPAPLGAAIIPEGRLLLYQEAPQKAWPPHGSLPHSPLCETIPAAASEIAALWPEAYDWIRLLVPAIVDIGPSAVDGVHQTASFGYGLPIYMGPVPDPMLHAEDLVHETQHQRFHLLLRARRLFPSWDESATVFVSPYRSDPRPLSGLHLGLHAFVAVNELRRRQLERNACSANGAPSHILWRMLVSHCGNLLAYRTALQHSGSSAASRAYFAALRELLNAQTGWIEARAGTEIRYQAEQAVAAHVREVQAAASTALANTGEDSAIAHL